MSPPYAKDGWHCCRVCCDDIRSKPFPPDCLFSSSWQDTGSIFGVYKTLSYAEALLEFFSSLSTPIVPPTLFPTLEIDSQNIQSSARRFLEELPPVHYNVLLYVISFFREALVYRDMNRLTAAKLARICTNHLAPTNSGMDDSTAAQRRSGMQLIMVHLLETNSI